ncbi:MAG: hypothetical protein ACREP8_16265 [Candidatus Binatia bacterium]
MDVVLTHLREPPILLKRALNSDLTAFRMTPGAGGEKKFMTNKPRDYFLNLSPGKLMGIRRVADERGRFAVLALDQTGVFRRAFGDDATRTGQAKLELARAISPHASSVLLDVPTSLRQALNSGAVPRGVGLVARLEKAGDPGDHGYEEPGWSVGKIKSMGADAVKLLVYMSVDDRRYTQAQLDFVRRTSDACREHDILLMTEELSFPRGDAREPDGKATAYRERRTRNILQAAELIGPYTDVLKLEFPGEKYLSELNQTAQRPWVLLSAGVDFEIFQDQVEAAVKAGASGIMAGRAIFKEWLDPESAHFQKADFLSKHAAERMRTLAAIVDRDAPSWLQRYNLSLQELASSVRPGWYSPFAVKPGSGGY